MRRNVAIYALIALTLGSARALQAQGRDRGLVELPARPVRSGLYLTGGLGNGLEQYQYSDAPGYTSWLSSPAAVLRIGGTPNQSVRLGAELFGWWNKIFDADQQLNATDTFSAFLLDAQFYPDRRAGFYVKGGMGIARSGESFECCIENVSETGFGWSIGAGYDLPLSRGLAIAPTIDFYQGSFAQRGQPTITEHVLNVGVSLTFQSGGRRWR